MPPLRTHNCLLDFGNSSMRFVIFLIAIFVFLTSLARAAVPPDAKHNGKATLDLFKDVNFSLYEDPQFSNQLMQDKNKFETKTIVFGGYGEFDLQHWQGNKIFTIPPPNRYHNGSGFYFTNFTLNTMTNFTHWGSAFFSVANTHIGQSEPNGNYIYIPHAFLLFGDLEKTPFYLTLGISSIPFGSFLGTGIWDIPLTSDYFNPQQAPQVSLAFYKNNWNLSVTEFDDEINHDSHFVYNISYTENNTPMMFGAGTALLTNLKSNMTGNPTVNRRGRTIANDMGNAWNINSSIGYQIVKLTGEYVVGSHRVDDNHGKPAAFGAVLFLTPTLWNGITTFALSYSQTFHLQDIPTTLSGLNQTALTAAGLKRSWAASISRPISKYFQIGLDAEKDVTYDNAQTFTYTLDLIAYI